MLLAQTGAARATAPVPHPVRLKTEDGAQLEGDEWLPSEGDRPAAGILLLHGAGGTRKAWGDFPATLARAGYRVLAIDLRGQDRRLACRAGRPPGAMMNRFSDTTKLLGRKCV